MDQKVVNATIEVDDGQTRDGRHSIFNWDNLKWLIGTLAIPAALALIAHEYQQAQADRQISDARLRLYTELLSKREAADTDVRRGIFDKVLEKYLAPGSQDMQTKLVALDLLASNFHQSLDLSPLFWQLDRDIQHANSSDRKQLSHQLIRIADSIKDRQISALELGTGDRGTASKEANLQLNSLTNDNGAPHIDEKFSFPDPDPFAPTTRVLTRHFKLWVVAHDPHRRRVYAAVQVDPNPGEKPQHWGFWIDIFDLPMVNFTRVSRTERFTVVLREYEPLTSGEPTAKVRLIYFPSARVGAQDKPFIDDVIADLVHERKPAMP